MKIFKPDKISILNDPEINEKIIQQKIAEDPTILGLGELVLKDKERIQPKAGRLDLLLQDIDTGRRYEVEIQLGPTDESHIIRTLEYWDYERKRYPQYDHCAVIVAEEITARFHNVISLFNGNIPLIAIQMSAYRFGDGIALTFEKVLDEVTLGLLDEDEEVAEVTDRSYWVDKGSEKTVKMADTILEWANEIEPGYELKYNKFYIGLAKDERPRNFITVRPQRSRLRIDFKAPFSEDNQQMIEESGLEDMGYGRRWGVYRISVTPQEIGDTGKQEVIKTLLKLAHDTFGQ
jgi:predicted transport protein